MRAAQGDTVLYTNALGEVWPAFVTSTVDNQTLNLKVFTDRAPEHGGIMTAANVDYGPEVKPHSWRHKPDAAYFEGDSDTSERKSTGDSNNKKEE